MSDFYANFILSESEIINANIGLTETQPISATFSINLTPSNTSQLVNDSDFIIDANYVHTDNNYSNIDKNKLATIATGAEVNVNADWNAISGDAQILNKPDITTMARQAISETVEGLTYTNTTGILSLTTGYIIPTLTSFNNKVDKEVGKGLSENDFTNTLKSNYDTAYTNTHTHSNKTALDNVGGINTGDQDLTGYALIDDLPTKISELANDSGFISEEIEPVFVSSPAYDITADNMVILNNTSGTNTGDQDLSSLATKIELQKVKNLSIAMAVAL